MGKKEELGVRRDKPINRKRRRLLRKVLGYLKSDHFMFAPLISRSPSFSSAAKGFCSSTPGFEIEQPIKQNDQKLVKKLKDYLKSDSYMYASLIPPQPLNPPTATGALGYLQTTATAISMRKTPNRSSQSTEHSVDARAEVRPIITNKLAQQTAFKGTPGDGEHMVYQSCHSSPLPDKKTVLVKSKEAHIVNYCCTK